MQRDAWHWQAWKLKPPWLASLEKSSTGGCSCRIDESPSLTLATSKRKQLKNWHQKAPWRAKQLSFVSGACGCSFKRIRLLTQVNVTPKPRLAFRIEVRSDASGRFRCSTCIINWVTINFYKGWWQANDLNYKYWIVHSSLILKSASQNINLSLLFSATLQVPLYVMLLNTG